MNPHAIVAVSDSMADDRGLVSRSVSARVTATRELFMRHTGLLELRCEVTAPQMNPPIRPPPTPLTGTVYMTLLELRGQKFDWLSSSGNKNIHCFNTSTLITSLHFQVLQYILHLFRSLFAPIILYLYSFVFGKLL